MRPCHGFLLALACGTEKGQAVIKHIHTPMPSTVPQNCKNRKKWNCWPLNNLENVKTI
jgi:hypothetical protein